MSAEDDAAAIAAHDAAELMAYAGLIGDAEMGQRARLQFEEAARLPMTAPSPAGLSPLLDQLDEAPPMTSGVARVVIRDLTDAIRAVLELHARRESHGDVDCIGCRGECLYCESEHEWPCPTVAVLTAALTPGADTVGATR